MVRIRHLGRIVIAAAVTVFWLEAVAPGQPFGVELHNNLMPASGAMAGTSLAQPQDPVSAINGNPATLRQFLGTQFTFGGAWAEPTINMTQTDPLPLLGVSPYSGKSTAQGSGGANLGVTKDFDDLGIPATMGIGFVSGAGGVADYRHIPESNGTNAALTVFEIPMTLGLGVTDRFSIGGGLSLGIGLLDGPFVGVGGMTGDYALRGVVGGSYSLTDSTNIGLYYQSEQSFRFDNAVRFQFGPITTFQDVNMDLPQNVGWGIADRSLMDGKLLVAADVLYKMWNDTDLFGLIYRNQWVFQFGTQYSMGKFRLRSGYAYAENPIDQFPVGDLGGFFPPGGPPALRYTQGLLAVTSPHRISAGIGVVDALPGIDLDVMAGGMFQDTEQLGPSTTSAIASYWAGMGLTWRFGGCGDTCQTCQ